MAQATMESKTTTDHETIKHWIQERGGRPAIVKGTQFKGNAAGLLRVDFGESNQTLEEISWEEFFDTFEKKGLAFLYRDGTDDEKSRFFKFIARQNS